MQGFKGLKYFSTIVAISIRIAYSLDKGFIWESLAWITYAITAIFAMYWDVVIDWGLLQRNSDNWNLRDKLLIVHDKSVHFGATMSGKEDMIHL